MLVVVLDAEGREVVSKIIIIEKSEKSVSAIDPYGKLRAGIYYITASSNQTIYRQKLVVW